MKISRNNLVNNFTDLRFHTRENSSSYVTSGSEHNFDAITIQSNRRQIEERTFAGAISKKLSSDVSNIASEEKIQNLQNQITSRAYPIDTRAIASKILLVREGV